MCFFLTSFLSFLIDHPVSPPAINHRKKRFLAMKSAYLLLLAAVAVCDFSVNHAQSIPSDTDLEERPTLRDILQRAESLLIRSIIRKIEEDDNGHGK